MELDKTVLVVGGDTLTERMFEKNGWTIVTVSDEGVYPAVDLVCFTGGSDVSPTLYNEETLDCTHYDLRRDLFEVFVYNQYLDTMKVGICRGGQFLNVMNGGRMYQDVDGHATGKHHLMRTDDERIIEVTSTHHQMMIDHCEGELIGWAYEATLKRTFSISHTYCENSRTPDAEIVYYPGSLCFQPHPEYDEPGNEECTEYFFELIDEHLELEGICADFSEPTVMI